MFSLIVVWYIILSVHSRFAIVSLGKKEPVDLLK